jgi:ubiquinone/menaquinone biosynthesis C-methylase UbiE
VVDFTKINKKWWNGATNIHVDSELYNLPSFKKGKTSLQTIELKELGDVKGKTLLHLMCHFGMDTLSWAREGAVVTGVDLSDESIALAQRLSKENNIPGKFICSDIYDLPKVLDQKFDIVFMSYGVLLWLSDIKKWAKLVSHFLKKNGVFYIVELHPFTSILTHDFKIDDDYFDKGPYRDDSPGTYTDWEADLQGTTYQWKYTMSDILNALIDAGLQIEFMHEFPFTMYDQFPGFMKKNAKGQYVLKDSSFKIPLLFSLKATKSR